MTDLEGIAKQLLAQGTPKDQILQQLVAEYQIFKDLPLETLERMAGAVLKECEISHNPVSLLSADQNAVVSKILTIPMAGVTMGKGGVGCRGKGDFFVHKLLTELSQTGVTPLVSPQSLDDTGAVELKSPGDGTPQIILSKMEGREWKWKENQ